ncbi:MAG TPA: aldehyde dehydrogenase family protein, partial [Nonomuraea sp.]|nr:aldehyde dehydrogenase family protein [Nonomuraea sp.]
MLTHDRLFLGGGWKEPAGRGRIEVVSPATEEVIGWVPDASALDADRAVEAAREAFDRRLLDEGHIRWWRAMSRRPPGPCARRLRAPSTYVRISPGSTRCSASSRSTASAGS